MGEGRGEGSWGGVLTVVQSLPSLALPSRFA